MQLSPPNLLNDAGSRSSRHYTSVMMRGVTAVVFLSLSACAGHAAPGSAAMSPSSDGHATDPASALPPRPRDLQLAGHEPCSLLAGSAVARLGVGPGSPHGVTSAGSARQCQWSTMAGHPSEAIVARLLPEQSAASMVGLPDADGTVTVDGYPAVRTTTPGGDPQRDCVLYVDVADHQTLVVEYLRGLDGLATDRTSACRGAQAAAASMVQSLADNQG